MEGLGLQRWVKKGGMEKVNRGLWGRRRRLEGGRFGSKTVVLSWTACDSERWSRKPMVKESLRQPDLATSAPTVLERTRTTPSTYQPVNCFKHAPLHITTTLATTMTSQLSLPRGTRMNIFHPFLRLPIELQLHIWDIHISPSQ